MPKVRFDTYYRYSELSEALHQYANEYPHLIDLESIGLSHEGREILLLTVTRKNSGLAGEKPAIWVDGNIHSAELVGSMACLYLLHTLVSGSETDAEILRCLDTHAFYICPRVNPDGAEWALESPARIIRSGTRPYPHNEEPVSGLVAEDMDADGRILSMRIPDPNGAWKKHPKDARLMVPREPAESGGEYFRLLPEGRIEHYDGFGIPAPVRKENLDLNRNFPVQWKAEYEQKGAGEYPTSEPEVRALVDFISRHKNICSAIAFHSYSGVLLRPYSYQADEKMTPEDLWTYQKIGQRGTEITGYPAVSCYHEFQYHPSQVITGALDDWFYEERGGFSWTVEVWSPQRRAGIEAFRFIDWYRTHGVDDDEKMLHWNDTELEGKGFIDWYRYEHPQLGPVELGGWDPLFSFWNPPPRLLEKEIARFPEWVIWHNLISPRLAIHDSRVTALGEGMFQVTVVVQNTGWLPTYVTKKGLEKKLARGVVLEISLPETAELVSGKPRYLGDQLEGRAYKSQSPFGWAGQVADPTEDLLRVDWVVRAPSGGSAVVCARHERAGVVRCEISMQSV